MHYLVYLRQRLRGDKMKKGDRVKGRITGIKPYGAFVKVGSENGLIHISELSDQYVRDIEDYVSVGDTVELEVINIEKDGKLSLSYKRLNKRKKRYRITLKDGFKPLEEALPKFIKNYEKAEEWSDHDEHDD